MRQGVSRKAEMREQRSQLVEWSCWSHLAGKVCCLPFADALLLYE